MTNNNTNVNNSDIKMSNLNNQIPTTWKKYGEIYCNKLEQPVFVCSICLHNVDDISKGYSTSDASAFWCHIQYQHISVEYETIDKISEEQQNFMTNGVESEMSKEENTAKMDESADLNVDGIVKKNTQIKLLEEFHTNLVKNNVKEANILDYVQPNIKPGEMEECVNKFLNCNDNETYTISDEDDNDDDEGKEAEVNENHDILSNNDETNHTRETNYLRHNDMIEISDDENDVDTNSNSLTTNEETIISEETNRMKSNTSDSGQINHFDIFNSEKQHNNEGNHLPHSNDNMMHSATVIRYHPHISLSDISPCESPSNQHFNTNLNIHSEECTTDSQSDQYLHLPKMKVVKFRAFQCNICDSRTVSKDNMEGHLQRVHNVSPLEFGGNEYPHKRYQLLQEPLQRNHISDSQTRQFKCKICKATTKTEGNMNKHQMFHHGPDAHLFTTICGICNKKVLKTKLEKHMLRHSSSGQKCDYCGIVCRNKYDLNVHISKYHSGMNSYSIPEYPQSINTNFNIPPKFCIQNNQQYHNNQSVLISSTLNPTSVNLTPVDEQQLQYRECQQQIWKFPESSNIVPLFHDPQS